MTMTIMDMCREIADAFERVHDLRVTPQAVFEISPTGELWPVYGLYDMYVRRSGYDTSVVPYVARLLQKGVPVPTS